MKLLFFLGLMYLLISFSTALPALLYFVLPKKARVLFIKHERDEVPIALTGSNASMALRICTAIYKNLCGLSLADTLTCAYSTDSFIIRIDPEPCFNSWNIFMPIPSQYILQLSFLLPGKLWNRNIDLNSITSFLMKPSQNATSKQFNCPFP